MRSPTRHFCTRSMRRTIPAGRRRMSPPSVAREPAGSPYELPPAAGSLGDARTTRWHGVGTIDYRGLGVCRFKRRQTGSCVNSAGVARPVQQVAFGIVKHDEFLPPRELIRTRTAAFATVVLYGMAALTLPIVGLVAGTPALVVAIGCFLLPMVTQSAFIGYIRIRRVVLAQRRAADRFDHPFALTVQRPTWQGMMMLPPGPLVVAIRIILGSR